MECLQKKMTRKYVKLAAIQIPTTTRESITTPAQAQLSGSME